MRSPDLLLIPEKLKSLGNITDVVDESWPAYDLEELYKRYSGTLIGDYIGYFLAKKGMDTVIAQDGYQTFENKKFREDPEQGYGAYSRDQCALRRKRER